MSLISFLLSTLALADLHKISQYIERDIVDVKNDNNEYSVQMGINEFTSNF